MTAGRQVVSFASGPVFPAHAKTPKAGIAQLVERNLAKVEVASSNLVSRSKRLKGPTLWGLFALMTRDTGSNVYDLFLRLARSLRRNFALLFDLQ